MLLAGLPWPGEASSSPAQAARGRRAAGLGAGTGAGKQAGWPRARPCT